MLKQKRVQLRYAHRPYSCIAWVLSGVESGVAYYTRDSSRLLCLATPISPRGRALVSRSAALIHRTACGEPRELVLAASVRQRQPATSQGTSNIFDTLDELLALIGSQLRCGCLLYALLACLLLGHSCALRTHALARAHTLCLFAALPPRRYQPCVLLGSLFRSQFFCCGVLHARLACSSAICARSQRTAPHRARTLSVRFVTTPTSALCCGECRLPTMSASALQQDDEPVASVNAPP